MNFTISMQAEAPEALITVAGELDVFTCQQLRDKFQDAVDQGGHHVLLDLAGVTFADASAIRVITLSSKYLADRGGSLQLVAWSPQVLRLCRMAGIDKALRLTDATPA